MRIGRRGGRKRDEGNRAWVWLADILGLALLLALLAAATGAPALAHATGWLMLALPIVGTVLCARSESADDSPPPAPKCTGRRTIVITPEPAASRAAAR